ncbi:MAG: hydrogenase formation protein HypD [Desulfobacca sp. 4484_104]|nr:MAG: hydrogenase formation protein HypD [Desulfobacca sp. 4484_104]RLA89644.1 MAG: hydrogenase formation protein HypD [Deltaproteobacteria bacterium]
MKFLDEYRDPQAAASLAQAIHRLITRPWTIMEVCGTQTHALVKYGIDQLLPGELNLAHGPGCPVCVTPIPLIDKALEIARRPGVILCSFGDMLRVPGSGEHLLAAKASGAQVRLVYSPLEVVRLAQAHPQVEVVFFAVGFETTAPATALAILQAQQLGLANFSVLGAQVILPPAISALLDFPGHNLHGFLLAGHVCTVTGFADYESLAQRYQVPMVVTGFEPIDLLQGIYLCLQQLETGRVRVENQYLRAVQRLGNPTAQGLIWQVFELESRQWRGLGEIPASGLRLQDPYRQFEAQQRFGPVSTSPEPPSACISGQILQGRKKPWQCPAFGRGCTPSHPLGAPMVSSEGACAAYYHYHRQADASRDHGRALKD